MSPTLRKVARCAALGLAVVGCQHRAASPTTTAASTTAATSAAATAQAGVGVVANCAGPAPYLLSSEPPSVILACGDAGVGVQDLTWTNWTASTAQGYGLLWENLCVPNCATGELGHYPVDVTLSAVRSSPRGPWFSRLSVTWEGNRPPNQTPNTFTLMRPSS